MELSDITLGFVGFGAMTQRDAPVFARHVKRILVSDIDNKQLAKVDELRSQGITNVEARPSNSAVARESDIIAVATTPIREVPQRVLEAAEAAKVGSLLTEYTSVKTHVEAVLRSGRIPKDLRWTLFHPMRGPSLPPQGNTHVFVHDRGIDSRNPLQAAFENLLTAVGGRIVHLNSAAEHDRKAALVQSATHFGYFALLEAYFKASLFSEANPGMPSGITYKQPNAIDHGKMTLTERLGAQHKRNPQIYPPIAAWNSFMQDNLETILQVGAEIRTAQTGGDKRYLQETFGKVVEYLGESNIRLAEEEIEEIMRGEFPLLEDTGDSNISLLHIGAAWYRMGADAHPSRNMIFASPPYRIMALLVLASFAKKRLDASVRNALKPDVVTNDMNYWLALEKMSTPLTTALEPIDKERFYSQRLTDTAKKVPQPVLDYGLRRSDELIGRLPKAA